MIDKGALPSPLLPCWSMQRGEACLEEEACITGGAYLGRKAHIADEAHPRGKDDLLVLIEALKRVGRFDGEHFDGHCDRRLAPQEGSKTPAADAAFCERLDPLRPVEVKLAPLQSPDAHPPTHEDAPDQVERHTGDDFAFFRCHWV